jgi:hypothetical protein
MLHMSQNAFQYLSQPVAYTEMRLDADTLYRKKSRSRHLYVELQDKVRLVIPKKALLTGREN